MRGANSTLRFVGLFCVLCAVTASAQDRQPIPSSRQDPVLPGANAGATTVRAMGLTGTLYDQINNSAGTGLSSQTFESAFSGFNDEAADDFVVPAGFTWTIQQIEVAGFFYNCAVQPCVGPISSVDVVFYADAGGLPGSAVAGGTFTAVIPTSGTSDPAFVIPISPNLTLPEGTYWVSVRANMAFTPNGQWAWSERYPPTGSESVWQNPGGSFGDGCTSWGLHSTTCGVDTNKGDQMFRLVGQVGDADLSLTKTASIVSESGPPFSAFTYQIDVKNAGPYEATNVVVTDPINAQLSVTGSTCGGTYSLGTFTWNIGTLADSGTASCTVTIQPLNGASGVIGNTATVSGDQPDPTPSDNSNAAGSADVNFINANTAIDLVMSKTAGVSSPIQRNQSFGYTLSVHNADAGNTASGVTVKDILDSRLSYVSNTCSASWSSPTLTWTIGNLAPTATSSCTLNVQVSGTASGTIANTAQVLANNPPTTAGHDTSTSSLTVASADVSVTKSTSFTNALAAGQTTTFTIQATNNGPDSATNVVVHDTLDPGLAYVSDNCAGGLASGVWHVGTLTSSGSASCTMTVSVKTGVLGAIQNQASVSADQFDPNGANNTSAAVAIGAVAHRGSNGPYSFVDSVGGVGAPTFSWVDISGTGTALNIPYGGLTTVPVGFQFPLYGNVASSVGASTNGGLLFNLSGFVPYLNASLPAALGPAIFPFWDDLDTGFGNVYSQRFTTCPNTQGGGGRCLVVEWYEIPHHSHIGAATFEAILYERGNILFQYLNTTFGDSSVDNGVSATAGIEGTAPNEVLEYEFNTPGSLRNDFAILFVRQQPTAVPLFGGWGLLALVGFLAAAGALVLRRT